MNISRIKKITQKNIDKLIKENLYRGHCVGSTIYVQCMDKDDWIRFDFANEVAIINDYKQIEICDLAPKRLFNKIYNATC